MAIEIRRKETRAEILRSIKRYFAENLDEEIGDLKASLLLEFILEEIGPVVYNQAIADAQSYMQDKVTDLDASCTQPEFQHWRS